MLDAIVDFLVDATVAPHADAGGSERNVVARLLALEDILLDVDATTRDRVFVEIGRLIAARHGLREQAVVAGLAAREKLGSTALGLGVAIPHARVNGLAHPIAAFVRPRLAIPFDAPDAKPVSFLLFLLVPERATDAHLALLAQAASMFCDKAFRDRLNTSVAAPEILATFAAWRPD
jgi:PTS system nitrogen regulatory IIA component